MQRVYLELIDTQLNGRSPADGDARPFLRGELRALDRTIDAALTRAADRATTLHLEDARDQIARFLRPPTGASSSSEQTGFAQAYDIDLDFVAGLPDPWSEGVTHAGESCWPDLAVRVDRP